MEVVVACPEVLEEGAADAEGTVLAGVDSVGGGGEPYPTLVHF